MLRYEEHNCYPENVTLRAQEGNCFSSASKKSSDYMNAFTLDYPFGLTMPGRSANTANPNDNYKFTGYENDDEGGLDLYHANARGYDPVLGRFMQLDTLAS
jgi:RHS repeat-associated protein